MNRVKSFFHTLFCIFLPFLPVLELYRSFFGGKIALFGFAVEELLPLFIVFLLFGGGVFFALREKKKILIPIFTYLILFLIYTFFHAKNSAAVRNGLISSASPDFFREVYYTLRMYLAPICLIFAAPLLSLPKKKILFSLKILLFIVSFGILIPLFTSFSYASYLEGNQMISGGFFSWFALSDGADFAAFTVRGFFPRANVVGAVLFGLSPLAVYLFLKDKKRSNLLLLFCTGFAAIAVGTKIASFGFFLAFFAGFFLFFISSSQKGKPIEKKAFFSFLLVVLILLPFFLISPGFKLQQKREMEKETATRPQTEFHRIAHLTEQETLSPEDITLLSEYLETYGWDHFIDPWFPSLYPAETDPEFWLGVLSRDGKENQNAREFKAELCKRVMEQNGGKFDFLLGLGFTSSIPYIEQDFIHQYYQFGLLGILVLFFPFLAVALKCAFLFLRSLLQKKAAFFPAILALSFFCFFAAAYFAGHVFDALFTTYCLASVAALSLTVTEKNTHSS